MFNDKNFVFLKCFTNETEIRRISSIRSDENRTDISFDRLGVVLLTHVFQSRIGLMGFVCKTIESKSNLSNLKNILHFSQRLPQTLFLCKNWFLFWFHWRLKCQTIVVQRVSQFLWRICLTIVSIHWIGREFQWDWTFSSGRPIYEGNTSILCNQ